MGTIGFFVLLLACINFMNLSTARSEKRSKEVGIRKTVGSVRNQLIYQFLSEALVVSLSAAVLSMVITQLSLPFFNTLSDKLINIPWVSITFWLALIGFVFLSGIISGSYPAFYLSSFKPAEVLKGVFRPGKLAGTSRKILVVLQFTVSTTLIIGTLVVYRQIQFAKNRPAGYTRDGLITVPISTDDVRKHAEAIRSSLLQTGVIEKVAQSSQSPAHFNKNNAVDSPVNYPVDAVFFRNVNVTPDFGKTIGWTIKEGRDFSGDIVSDSAAAVFNERAIEIMGLENPIGEHVRFDGRDYAIIGIVKNMVTQSPYAPVQPAIFLGQGWLSFITIRIKPTVPVREAISRIEPIFKKYNPSAPFEYSFVDEKYGRKFASEEKTANLVSMFAILAAFISCLGIFGLSAFVAEQRSKEIGIRKVMGASVANVWRMLSMDFVGLILISVIFSIPLALSFMLDWLERFEYRTSLPWYMFAGAGAGAVILTLATISYQALKAAMANPVDSIKTE
jgi:ABC-type antimicrobial peptide transport system permease subunit